MLGIQGSLIEAVFSIEGDTGIAFGGGLGVESGSGGGAKLGLRPNVLESNNGAVRGWFRREGVTKGLTIRGPERDTQESGLSEMTVWC